jgi:single-strand DNA-binding protein
MSNFNINRVVLVGRLTRDPELRALPSGVSVCSLRLACNSSWRDAEGAIQERPNYFDVSVYGAATESVSRYMRKGSRVAIDGRLEWREWETADQRKRQAVSVVAGTVQFLDGPGERPGAHDDEGWEGPRGDDDASEEAGAAEDQQDRELVGAGAGAGKDDLTF